MVGNGMYWFLFQGGAHTNEIATCPHGKYILRHAHHLKGSYANTQAQHIIARPSPTRPPGEQRTEHPTAKSDLGLSSQLSSKRVDRVPHTDPFASLGAHVGGGSHTATNLPAPPPASRHVEDRCTMPRYAGHVPLGGGGDVDGGLVGGGSGRHTPCPDFRPQSSRWSGNSFVVASICLGCRPLKGHRDPPDP